MKFAKLLPDATLPTRKHFGDAGTDLYAYLEDRTRPVDIRPGEYKIIHTGITAEIPLGEVGLIWPKSRYNFLIGGGVIDYGYQGEILVKVINPTRDTVYVEHGQAIAQLLVQKIDLEYAVEEVSITEIHQHLTDRGQTGGIVSQLTN